MNINKILEQIEAGLDGVTPGPWRRKPMKGYTDDYVLTDHPDFQQPKHGNLVAECGFSGGKVEHRYEADAAHIARCDPDTMRAIIVHIRELEARVELAESEQLEQARLLGMSADRELALLSRAKQTETENRQAVGALKMILKWADERCPCENELPDPCPLCGASVANLQPCLAAENTIPPDILRNIRAALVAMEATDE